MTFRFLCVICLPRPRTTSFQFRIVVYQPKRMPPLGPPKDWTAFACGPGARHMLGAVEAVCRVQASWVEVELLH